MSATTAEISLGMQHQMRTMWRTSRPFAIGATATTVVFHLLAIMTAIKHDDVEAAGISTSTLVPLAAGLWSALALLPALGGGDSDDPLAVAAIGGGRSFTFGSRFAAAITDAGPGLFVPSLALVGAAAAGWPGWLAGLTLAWNGVAVGQLTGAGSAILMRRLGPTWALLVIAAIVLAIATVFVRGGNGPMAWWGAAVSTPWYVIALLAGGLAALWGSWLLNRPNDRTLKAPRELHLPQRPVLALSVAMAAGIGRSVAARSTVMTAALAPLLVRGAGTKATVAVAFFIMAAAAGVIGSNGFAYDGGAAVWLLGRVSSGLLIAARMVATSVWIFALAVVASVSGLLTGAPISATAIPALVIVAIGIGAAGLAPSIKRPMSTDFDSFRTQAAPVVSALGSLARATAIVVVVVYLPLWAGALAVAAYMAFAVLHARRLLVDPVALAALS